jgi:ribosome-associated protein
MDLEKLHESIVNSSQVSYSRSGGPGGQNVNKVNTKVTLKLLIDKLEGLTESEYEKMKIILSPKLSGDGNELVIQSSDERLQSINEENAYKRLEAMVISAAKLQRKRRPTRPTKASREERLKIKKLNAEVFRDFQ